LEGLAVIAKADITLQGLSGGKGFKIRLILQIRRMDESGSEAAN
jgi:hypothetical protein